MSKRVHAEARLNLFSGELAAFTPKNVGTAFVAVGLVGVLSACIRAAMEVLVSGALAAAVETVNWSSFEQLKLCGSCCSASF